MERHGSFFRLTQSQCGFKLRLARRCVAELFRSSYSECKHIRQIFPIALSICFSKSADRLLHVFQIAFARIFLRSSGAHQSSAGSGRSLKRLTYPKDDLVND